MALHAGELVPRQGLQAWGLCVQLIVGRLTADHTNPMGCQRSFRLVSVGSRAQLRRPRRRRGSARLQAVIGAPYSKVLPSEASRTTLEGQSARQAMAWMTVSWMAVAGLVGSGIPHAAMAEGQVQLTCAGTLLEARGQAERQRPTARLRASLSLDADAGSAVEALDRLQQRLASVRSALQALGAQDLRVSSPSTWARPRTNEQDAIVAANVQVSASLPPDKLQALIRTVGTLAGVRLAPVETEADPGATAQVREELFKEAYRDALNQAQPMASLINRSVLTPVEIRLETDGMQIPFLRTMSANATPPFNPDELNKPRNHLAMLVRFCAR